MATRATRADNILDSIDHSHKQEKWAENRVTAVFRDSSICPDKSTQSKYEGMEENKANGALNSHDRHEGTAISWNTYHTYKSACIPLAVFAKTEGVHDIYRITPQVISDYMIKVVDCGVKYSTFEKICSAIEKFCACVNEHNGSSIDFHKVIDDYKASAKEALPASDFVSRSYDNPAEIIGNLTDEKMQIVAELQLTCGLRISDACHFSPSMIHGSDLTVNSKNGQEHTVTPSPQLMGRIQAVVASEGHFGVNRDSYSNQLEKACNAAGEDWHGTHGLRHTFAKSRMTELTGMDMSYNKALRIVSEEMGHHRPEITEWYLR